MGKDIITLEGFKMGKSEIFQDFNFKLVVIDALLDKE
ncbi:ybaK/ebsC family protein, partial [Bacillus cereus]